MIGQSNCLLPILLFRSFLGRNKEKLGSNLAKYWFVKQIGTLFQGYMKVALSTSWSRVYAKPLNLGVGFMEER